MQLRRATTADGHPGAPTLECAGVPEWLSPSWARAVVLLLLRQPGLWPVAVRQLWELAPNRWWCRRPYLPLPAPDYLRFRLQTMYGSGDHTPDPADLIRWLAWCRSQKANR